MRRIAVSALLALLAIANASAQIVPDYLRKPTSVCSSSNKFIQSLTAGAPTVCNQPSDVTGNAATATALAANPTDCSSGQYATAIAASGNLSCAQVAYADVSGTPTVPTVSGTTNQVAYFTGSSAVGSDGGLTYDATNDFLGVGGATGADAKIRISGTTGTSGLLTYRGIYEHQNIGAGAFGYSGVTVDPTTAASAAPTTIVDFLANDVTLGAGASVQNLTGFYSQVSSGTNNYGFYSNVPVGANNYAFYANGTARSQFGAQGIILSPLAGTPSTLTNGAMWYDSTGNDLFGVRINGATREIQTGPLTGDVTTASGGVATTIANGAVTVAKMAATGTPSASTYHRGDDTWATVSGVGSPLANNGEIYIYSGGANAALGAPATGNMGLVGSSTISNSKMRWERGLDDARYRSHFHEDFTNTQTTTTAGTLGSRIVTAVTNAAGVGTGFPGADGDLGKLQFDVTTTSPQQAAGAGIQVNSGSNRLIRMNNASVTYWRATFLLGMPANAPDGTNNYVFKVGLSDTFSGATGSNELYVDLTSGTNSGKWVIHEIHAGNVTTAVNSSATVCAVNALCEISFDWSSGSSVTVYQNGTSLGSIVNSIGTSTLLSPMVAFTKTAGATLRTGYWTDFTFDAERTTAVY